MAKQCPKCETNLITTLLLGMCDFCYNEERSVNTDELHKEVLDRSVTVRCFTTNSPTAAKIISEHGLVFGNSSKQAFWGLSTQADRLSRAYEAALSNLRYDAAALGANAVVGIQFALNNSAGSGAALITGSSEAVMLLGTAVTIE